MARRKKQGRKRQPPVGGRPVLLLMAVSIMVVLAVIFLTVLGVIETGVEHGIGDAVTLRHDKAGYFLVGRIDHARCLVGETPAGIVNQDAI
jgi:phosphotransferase system  glucose/maltose/N-acetylglucosamine-specific IIC component